MKYLYLFFFFLFSPVAIYSQAILRADGPGDTYELIASVLAPGYWPLETPDCSHEQFGRHIDETMDSLLNEYVFRFFIHVTPDDDRCINPDRQRNEIKVYDKSPDSLKGFRGDRMVYEWMFRLDSLFQPSSSFTHIHQLKAVGGEEDGMPVMTLTPRKASPDILQLRYAESDDPVTLATVPLSAIKGRWIRVREEVQYEENGSYEITLSYVADSTEIFHFRRDAIRMWRTGAAFIRPKWGIYRSLAHAGQLRDEEVLFNDFFIQKISSLTTEEPFAGAGIRVYPNPVTDVLHFDLSGDAQIVFRRIYDITGRVVRENHDRRARHADVSQLPAGFYYIEFREGTNVVLRRFVRQ